jgi:adenine-specific DNA-methyltransferase
MSGSPLLTSQRELVSAAMQLGAATVAGWSQREELLASGLADRAYNALASVCRDSLTRDSRTRDPPARDSLSRDSSARDAPTTIEELRVQIRNGADPLGCAFIQLHAPSARRTLGATYTPREIIQPMLAWAAEQDTPERVVDPGIGSGRFLLQAARLFPKARLVGVEIDPLAALIARANLAVAGVANRAIVILGDYRETDLRSDERTLFVGNPPYVRHHLIDTRWKQWHAAGWQDLGITASGLAGLHIHFFLATLLNARGGDYGAFVTSAEWLDVNYGSALRDGFLGNLGGAELIMIEPTAAAFPGAATTAAITLFRVGSHPDYIRVRRVNQLSQANQLPQDNAPSAVTARGSTEAAGCANAPDFANPPDSTAAPSPVGTPGPTEAPGRAPDFANPPDSATPRRADDSLLVTRARLEAETRWSRLTRPPHQHPAEFVELGELCRVHRGQATGANRVWIVNGKTRSLPPSVLFPTVTRARELISAGVLLSHTDHLRSVVDLPADLDELDCETRSAVEIFLHEARHRGAHATYVARHRAKWWSVGLRPAAPILATYMARHAPVFTRNPAGARHLNIAHGLYPREHLNEQQLCALVNYLSSGVSVVDGRTYAGGLTKFEPREMERIWVPRPVQNAVVAVGLG